MTASEFGFRNREAINDKRLWRLVFSFGVVCGCSFGKRGSRVREFIDFMIRDAFLERRVFGFYTSRLYSTERVGR